jgi:TctA family transporter
MKKWLINNKIILTGMVLGALAGYFYYRFIGCSAGTCLISSKPVNSTLYFAVMVAFFFSLFKKEKNENTNDKR